MHLITLWLKVNKEHRQSLETKRIIVSEVSTEFGAHENRCGTKISGKIYFKWQRNEVCKFSAVTTETCVLQAAQLYGKLQRASGLNETHHRKNKKFRIILERKMLRLSVISASYTGWNLTFRNLVFATVQQVSHSFLNIEPWFLKIH